MSRCCVWYVVSISPCTDGNGLFAGGPAGRATDVGALTDQPLQQLGRGCPELSSDVRLQLASLSSAGLAEGSC